MRILLCPTSCTDPASRFRLLQFVPPLRQLGHDVDVAVPSPGGDWRPPFQRENKWLFWSSVYAARFQRVLLRLPVILKAKRYDIIMINRRFILDGSTWGEATLQRRNPRIILDFDDAIFVTLKGRAKTQRLIELSAWVTPGNAYLAQFARSHSANVTIVPTVVDLDTYLPATTREPGPFRIGWSGSRYSIEHALPIVKPVLAALSRELDFEFVIISNAAPTDDWRGINMRFTPWRAESEVEDLQQIDIGLMPLEDSDFQRGKCGLKLLQYGGVGIPGVASPVGVNAEIIQHGQNGFLATTEAEWKAALKTLLTDDTLRRSMGQSAYQRVKDNYSVESILPTLIRIFERVCAL